MGDIADMIQDGVLCQECGGFVGDDVGFPRSCDACISEKPNIKPRAEQRATKPAKVSCPECSKRVSEAGMADHRRVVHGVRS